MKLIAAAILGGWCLAVAIIYWVLPELDDIGFTWDAEHVKAHLRIIV